MALRGLTALAIASTTASSVGRAGAGRSPTDPPFPPSGAAAWVYDVAGGQPAMWSGALGAFNGAAARAINVVFSYGGDMELYPDDPEPYQTYFAAQSQAAAALYKATPGVDYVVLVIDGRMDGTAGYDPDLSKLTRAQLKTWADVTATLYCSFETVDGIQLDLEPLSGKYIAPFLIFLDYLSANLRSPERNCISPTHPGGRSITTFMFAESVSSAVWSALGPNGYLTVSGYDLSDAPAGVPSSVADFKAALSSSVATVAASAAANNCSFFVGFPAAASAHEFASYTLANGTAIAGHPQTEYAQAALDVLATLKGSAGYLGPALWGFASEMAYPPHSQNVFLPGMPFSTPGEEDLLSQQL